ncbi:hypothetical protein [Microbacterium testaceum]|uniref:hypothetical protein n=1 Tax=Microbacterium testaceum TaxID=2033 RepID=UPI001403B164|nr:hypothetical protein [Microbacterium testaceum]
MDLPDPILNPDVDGELLIYVSELPRFISVLRPGDKEQTIYDVSEGTHDSGPTR